MATIRVEWNNAIRAPQVAVAFESDEDGKATASIQDSGRKCYIQMTLDYPSVVAMHEALGKCMRAMEDPKIRTVVDVPGRPNRMEP